MVSAFVVALLQDCEGQVADLLLLIPIEQQVGQFVAIILRRYQTSLGELTC